MLTLMFLDGWACTVLKVMLCGDFCCISLHCAGYLARRHVMLCLDDTCCQGLRGLASILQQPAFVRSDTAQAPRLLFLYRYIVNIYNCCWCSYYKVESMCLLLCCPTQSLNGVRVLGTQSSTDVFPPKASLSVHLFGCGSRPHLRWRISQSL